MAIVFLALCSITGSSSAPAQPPRVEIDWLPPAVSRFTEEIEAAASAHDVDPELVAIVVLLESGGDPAATSPIGARGLMQVMPATARMIAMQRGLPVPTPAELDDPERSLDFGAYLLGQLIAELTDGDLDAEAVGLVAAGYNAGLEHTRNWQAGRARLSRETRRYRARMMRLWRKRDAMAR